MARHRPAQGAPRAQGRRPCGQVLDDENAGQRVEVAGHRVIVDRSVRAGSSSPSDRAVCEWRSIRAGSGGTIGRLGVV